MNDMFCRMCTLFLTGPLCYQKHLFLSLGRSGAQQLSTVTVEKHRGAGSRICGSVAHDLRLTKAAQIAQILQLEVTGKLAFRQTCSSQQGLFIVSHTRQGTNTNTRTYCFYTSLSLQTLSKDLRKQETSRNHQHLQEENNQGVQLQQSQLQGQPVYGGRGWLHTCLCQTGPSCITAHTVTFPQTCLLVTFTSVSQPHKACQLL